MMTMREKMAMAMCERMHLKALDEVLSYERNGCFALVDLMLDALMEPTDAMTVAGALIVPDFDPVEIDETDKILAGLSFHVMICAAKEGK